MKKIVFLCLFIGVFYEAHAQNLLEEVKKLTLEKDSLQRELKHVKENSKKNLVVISDSIKIINSVHKTKIAELNAIIVQLAKDTTALQKEMFKSEQGKFLQGRQSVLDQIILTYQSITFDSIIKVTTQQFVERDLQLITNNEEVSKKMRNLLKYFDAKKAIEMQYDEKTVKEAQRQLNSIAKSELSEKLNLRLGKYKSYTEALKNTIGRIIEKDKKVKAFDEYSAKTKLQDILFELANHINNNHFDFGAYPYLSDIIIKIIKEKQRDADKDLTDFYNVL